MQMTDEQFYEFCQANCDLRIERTASGEVIIMPPVFSDTGNRNSKITFNRENAPSIMASGKALTSAGARHLEGD